MTIIYNLLNQTTMMKLLIAVLSSTLIACSVTTATPVNPSATANLGSSSTAIYTATATTYPSTSTFNDLNVNSVNCGDYSREKKKQSKNMQRRDIVSKKYIKSAS